MSFCQLALHFIKKRHPKIDLSWINFFSMEGHNILDPDDGSAKVPKGVDDAFGDEEETDDYEDNEMVDLPLLRT